MSNRLVISARIESKTALREQELAVYLDQRAFFNTHLLVPDSSLGSDIVSEPGFGFEMSMRFPVELGFVCCAD